MVTPLKDLGRDAIAAKGWLGAHKWLMARRGVQLGTLALFMLGPWAGIYILKGNLASSLLLGSVPLSDPLLFLQILAAGFGVLSTTVMLGAAIVALFYLTVGGRVFCAWVCPINIVTDAAHWSRRKLGLRATARFRAATRYWMLALVLVLAAATGTLAYELINPVSMVYRGLVFGMGLGWAYLAAIYLFDLLVARHGWCGHLCPTGAFYSLIGQASLVRIRADGRERCDDCMECYEVCPEPQVIPPAVKSAGRGGSPVILSGACTNCARCVDICPHDVFAFGLRNRAFAPADSTAKSAAPHCRRHDQPKSERSLDDDDDEKKKIA